jgi:4-hydroxy-2-oxoheptanedioate aldolase
MAGLQFVLTLLSFGGAVGQAGAGAEVPYDQPRTSGARGTLPVHPVDPGRPWGWAVRAFMDDPRRPLYNNAKKKLLEGRQIFSHTVTTFDIEAYCRDAQIYDFSRFEMQHSTLTFADVEKMIAACPRSPATPILRVSEPTEVFIQQAVDIGVLGIIIPTVDDGMEALAAARFARLPPTGRRSTGGGQAPTIWGPAIPQGSDFRNTINDNMLVIVMIETIEAVNNARQIAWQPGVDVVILGNNDLQSFSGYPPNSDGYQDLLIRVRNATYEAGKFWGNANSGFSVGNPLSADSRLHMGLPPGN